MDDNAFLHCLTTRSDPEALWSAATAWLSARGFDRVIHLSGCAEGRVSARTTMGQKFEEEYRAREFERIDPFMTHCLTAPTSVATGISYISEYSYLTAPETEVIHTAAEAGFNAGFTAVVRRNPQEWEAWNIGSTLSRREVEAIRGEDEATLRMGLAALRGRLGKQPAVNLSARERMCLDLLGCGLRTKAIAQELGISVVTVELHLRNARTKLGAATRDQALMLYRAKTAS